MIIFSEEEQFNNLKDNGFEKFINLRDLIILARKYRLDGNDDKEIKEKIINFCSSKTIDFNYAKYETKIIEAINLSLKEGIIINNISFSQKEMDWICSKDLEYQEQKMLFILCSLSKWQNHNYFYLNSDSLIQPKDVKELFKTQITENECIEIIRLLKEKKKIEVNLKPLLKININFKIDVTDSKDAILSFIPNDDMAYYFNKYKGEKIFRCEECGKLFKPSLKARYARWCNPCSNKIHNHKN